MAKFDEFYVDLELDLWKETHIIQLRKIDFLIKLRN